MTLLADNPDGEFKVFQKRKKRFRVQYFSFWRSFYILTNKDKAINFKLMKTPESKTSMDNWEDALAHREDVLLEDIDLLETFWSCQSVAMGWVKSNYTLEWKEEYYLPFERDLHCPCDFKRWFWYWYFTICVSIHGDTCFDYWFQYEN
jgi:oligopeptidase B